MAAPLSFYGIVLMAYSVWGYPWLQRVFGTNRLGRWGLLASIAVCFIIPLVATIKHSSDVAATVRVQGCAGGWNRERRWSGFGGQ